VFEVDGEVDTGVEKDVIGCQKPSAEELLDIGFETLKGLHKSQAPIRGSRVLYVCLRAHNSPSNTGEPLQHKLAPHGPRCIVSDLNDRDL
jgi:hypothetical protein